MKKVVSTCNGWWARGGEPLGGGRRGGSGAQRDDTRSRRVVGRRGFWVSLHGKDKGDVVEEGVDFAQDSEEGGGEDYLFISDSEDEINDDFTMLPHSDVGFICETDEQSEDGVEEQAVDEVEGLEQDDDFVEEKPVDDHAANLQVEAHSNYIDPLEQDDDAGEELRKQLQMQHHQLGYVFGHCPVGSRWSSLHLLQAMMLQ